MSKEDVADDIDIEGEGMCLLLYCILQCNSCNFNFLDPLPSIDMIIHYLNNKTELFFTCSLDKIFSK